MLKCLKRLSKKEQWRCFCSHSLRLKGFNLYFAIICSCFSITVGAICEGAFFATQNPHAHKHFQTIQSEYKTAQQRLASQ